MSSSGEAPDTRPQWGDYRLGELLAEDGHTRTYRAEQISVRREVLLEELKPEAAADPDATGVFLADVRAKAAVHHPGIGSVYEVLQHGDRMFYTREFLAGDTLRDLQQAGVRFDPRELLQLLRQAAASMAHLEEHRAATIPLEAHHLIIGSHHVLRLANLAVAADPDPRTALHDRQLLSELLLECLEEGRPGATRTTSLLHRLGSDRPDAPSWAVVGEEAAKLLRALERGRAAVSQPIGVPGPARRGPGAVLVVAGVLVGALAVVGGGLMLVLRQQGPEARPLDGMVAIPADEARGTGPFWIDAEEVTIAEYGAFLASLELIDPAQRNAYDHPDQPSSKRGHVPDDWEALFAAAASGGTWDGLPMDLNCPVVNVDWWDAYAYADWRGGRLPTEAEWSAAVQGATVALSGWGVVDAFPGDRTPAGVRGLAGNVAEWVRDPTRNPAFPMNPRKPVACGGSYREPHNGVRARFWLPSRDVRRPDVGFRILRETAPGSGE